MQEPQDVTTATMVRGAIRHARGLLSALPEAPQVVLRAALIAADAALDLDVLSERIEQYLWATLGALDELCGDNHPTRTTRWVVLAALAAIRGDEQRAHVNITLAVHGPEALENQGGD